MSKKITKKEVNTKKDYVVVEIYHERYSCDMCVQIVKNRSIVDIYNMYNFEKDFDITKLERQGYHEMGYVYDKCCHYDMDEYDCSKKENKRFKTYHIECLFIVELNTFLKEECFNCVFMDTNKKFGLVDYAKKPVDMHLDKNIIEKWSCELYEKYTWYQKFIEFTWNVKNVIYRAKRNIKKHINKKKGR